MHSQHQPHKREPRRTLDIQDFFAGSRLSPYLPLHGAFGEAATPFASYEVIDTPRFNREIVINIPALTFGGVSWMALSKSRNADRCVEIGGLLMRTFRESPQRLWEFIGLAMESKAKVEIEPSIEVRNARERSYRSAHLRISFKFNANDAVLVSREISRRLNNLMNYSAFHGVRVAIEELVPEIRGVQGHVLPVDIPVPQEVDDANVFADLLPERIQSMRLEVGANCGLRPGHGLVTISDDFIEVRIPTVADLDPYASFILNNNELTYRLGAVVSYVEGGSLPESVAGMVNILSDAWNADRHLNDPGDWPQSSEGDSVAYWHIRMPLGLEDGVEGRHEKLAGLIQFIEGCKRHMCVG